MDHVRRRVIKLGGTSVGTADRLETSPGIVEAGARERPVLVVTSALAGVVVVGAAGDTCAERATLALVTAAEHEVAVRALHDAFAAA